MVMHSEQSCAVIDVCMACLHIPSPVHAVRALFQLLVSAVALTDIFILRDHVEDVVRARQSRQGAASLPTRHHAVSLHAIFLMFKLSGWDVDVLRQFSESIATQVQTGSQCAIEALKKTLWKAELGYIPFFDASAEAKTAYEQVREALNASTHKVDNARETEGELFVPC